MILWAGWSIYLSSCLWCSDWKVRKRAHSRCHNRCELDVCLACMRVLCVVMCVCLVSVWCVVCFLCGCVCVRVFVRAFVRLPEWCCTPLPTRPWWYCNPCYRQNGDRVSWSTFPPLRLIGQLRFSTSTRPPKSSLNTSQMWVFEYRSKKFVDVIVFKNCCVLTTKALNEEYKSKGIIVQCVKPGFVATKLSGIKRPSLLAPTPNAFVKSALATIGK